METIEERAKEYADIHKATEFNYFGVGKVYGYERIYNAEITAYERGAKEQKAIDDEMLLQKCDDMTEAEYNRETAFVDLYLKNGKGTPTFSDAIEWARKDLLDKVCSWLGNYFVFEHEAMSAAHCDAFLRTLRKSMEE